MNLFVNPTITGFRQEVDGTIKELKIGEAKEDAYANIIEQGASDLDNNKTATINVSTYTAPVEIKPSTGKDGMKKATITLSNIPSPGGTSTLYAWTRTQSTLIYYLYTAKATPQVGDNIYQGANSQGLIDTDTTYFVEEVGENTITYDGDVYTRSVASDIVLQ